MGSSLTVAVAGATGAVGSEVIGVLDRVRWRPAEVIAAGSPTSVQPFVDYGQDRVPVEDLEHVDLGVCDALILAVPPGTGRVAARRAFDEGIAVVDLSGDLARDPDVPLIVPWINPEALERVGLRRAAAVPSAEALLVASLLGPLVRAGLSGRAHATLMLPASAWGRDGIEELSRQVTALFNAATPPRKVFPHGLAFDVVPVVGAFGSDGATDREGAIRREVAALIGDAFELSVTVVAIPVFSGLACDLGLHLARSAPPDLVARLLSDGGVRFPEDPGARYLPRPRRVEGEPFAHAGRVRATSADGRHLQLWGALDNLRATASAAVSLVGALLRDELREGA
jgi:aspartate-semialdehyde dehydrogenase